jgi:hypothetical protein
MRRWGSEEGGRRWGAIAELRQAIVRAEKQKTKGKRGSDDVHLDAELLQWVGAMERWRNGATTACPSLAAKDGATARVVRVRRRCLWDMRSLGNWRCFK